MRAVSPVAASTVYRNTDNSSWEKYLDWHKCKSNEDLVLPADFIDLANTDNTFEKHTYSALKQADLLTKLESKKIDAIDICGIDLVSRGDEIAATTGAIQ